MNIAYSWLKKLGKQRPSGVLAALAFGTLVVPIYGLVVAPCLTLAAGGKTAAGVEMGNAEQGRALFERRCTGCHSLDQDKEGPRLRSVYGRKAASVSTFAYSANLKQLGVTWDSQQLDKWLSDPEAMVPDTDMAYHVPKADERADLIRYLKSLTNN